MLANKKMENLMEEVSTVGRMVTNTMASGNNTKDQVREHFTESMEINMMVFGRMIINKEKGFIIILMVIAIKGNGKTIKKK